MSLRLQPSEFPQDTSYEHPGIPRSRERRYSEQAPDPQQSILRTPNSRQGRDYSNEDHLSAGEREFWREYNKVHGSTSGTALRIAYQQHTARRGAVSLQGRAIQSLRPSTRQILSTTRTSAIRRNTPPSTTPSIFSRILARLSSAISSRVRRQERRDCPVCLQSLSLTVFPAITPTCTHVPNICKECINTWLSTDGVLTALTWYNIQCPSQGCGEVIQPADISQFCTSELFARYERFATRSAVALEGEREEQEPAQHLFHQAQDQASAHYLSRNTQPCPGEVRPGVRCGIAVEKTNGCPHMKCLVCKAEFCWVCLMPWRNGLHLDECTGQDDVPLAWREFGS